MADLESFRADARAWLAANCPPSLVGSQTSELEGNWGGRRAVYPDPAVKLWLDRMAARGWTAPTWPREYGGGGLSPAEAKALSQEMARLRVPVPLIGFGLTMIGPTLLQYGSEEQRREHLPRIVRGEIRWCQGYSEPGAGSDLASLQTRAVPDGDHFVVNGTKVWTSYADECDWIFALVRTDPAAKKQDGITFLLIDLETPGVSVRPIRLISGSSPFCETHFEDVRVPARNVVGRVNGGWTVAKALLGHERSMIADAFGGSRRRDGGDAAGLPELARGQLGPARGPLADPVLRDAIAQNEMDTRCFLLTLQRTRDAAKAGHRPGPETSIFKVYGTELNQRRCDLAVRIAGPDALGWEAGAGFASDAVQRTRDWLRSRGNSIEGGTSEIQLNIIAKRVLGLPD
jgi:alkylation response protein AidB-like acyl-CoA dehydrogenase